MNFDNSFDSEEIEEIEAASADSSPLGVGGSFFCIVSFV